MYATDEVILLSTLVLKTSAIINCGMELPYCLTVCFMLCKVLSIVDGIDFFHNNIEIFAPA